MELTRLMRTALRSVLRNRMRSLLTVLGIIIGVASVIDMVAIGKGAQVQIEEQISSMGTNLVMIRPGAGSSGGIRMEAGSRASLTPADAQELAREDLFAGVSPVARSGAQIVAGTGNWQTSVYGVWPSYLTIRDWKVARGTTFDERDVRTAAKKALLGATVARELFGARDPVGERIRIRNVPFTVVGVLAAKGQGGMGQDQDDAVIAPVTTVMNRLAGSTNISQILVSVVDRSAMQEAQERIRAVLRESHRLADGEDDDFGILDQTEMMAGAAKMTGVMTALLGGIAGVSLLVGGIGIMNIMLVSVTERTREIGIRMAIGARGSDILLQFLVESVVLSVLGGIIGIVFAALLAWIANSVGLRAVIVPSTIAMAFGFSAAVGVFFGFYPARKASRLDPIEALRYE